MSSGFYKKIKKCFLLIFIFLIYLLNVSQCFPIDRFNKNRLIRDFNRHGVMFNRSIRDIPVSNSDQRSPGGGGGGGGSRGANKFKKRHPHRTDCPGHDVATRTYFAPTVIQAKVRSMSSTKSSTYAVTFEVKFVYKSQPKKYLIKPLVINETIRLHFAARTTTTTLLPNCDCLDFISNLTTYNSNTSSNSDKKCSSLVQAHLKSGKKYLLFLNRVGAHNFTVLGPPVASTNKSLHAVQRVLQRPNSVRPANVSELNDVTLRYDAKLKLECRTQGFPPPRVHWLKNGTESFRKFKRVRIHHFRRKSTLTISKVKSEDAGRYECTAKGVIGPPITKSAIVKVLQNNTRVETTPSADQYPCSENSAAYCMNGGTCMFFSTIGEYACQCATGYNGRRCESKMPNITKSTYTSYSCSNKYLC